MVTIPEQKDNTRMATSTITANPITVSISAKENEWVAPQFHRKVHVNNRIYIEGAGIEKLGYERLTEYFAQWGAVFNVELKVNNRDGRRQKKVYGFVTFQEEHAAAACIDSAKAGIEIEPGRPLSVRAAFFMPRRNSFDTEKQTSQNGNQQWNERASQPPSVPTIHDSRSPSPTNGMNGQNNFATGEWKNEMAQNGQGGGNGQMNKQVTVEEQARKLFDIFQSLPDNAKDRILQILNAQKYQEEQLRAIKEIRFDENPTPSNSISGSSTDSGISTLFSQVNLNGNAEQNGQQQQQQPNRQQPPSQNYSRNGMAHARDYNDNGYGKDNRNGSGMPMMPRYGSENGHSNPVTTSQPSMPQQQQPQQGSGLYGGQSGMVQRSGYQRQYSEPATMGATTTSQFNQEFNQFDLQPKQQQPQPPAAASAARPIQPKHLRNENGLSLELPESFGPSSPVGVWQMPNSPPNYDFHRPTRGGDDVTGLNYWNNDRIYFITKHHHFSRTRSPPPYIPPL